MKILSAFRSVFISPFSYFIFLLTYFVLTVMYKAFRTGDEFGLDASFISFFLTLFSAAYLIFLVSLIGGKTVGITSPLFSRLIKLWGFSLLASIVAGAISTVSIYIVFHSLFPGVTSEGRGYYVWLARAFVEKYLVYDFCLWPIWITVVLGYPFVDLLKKLRGHFFSVVFMFFLILFCANILLAVFENPPWINKESSLVLLAFWAGTGKLIYLSLFIFLLSMIKSQLPELADNP